MNNLDTKRYQIKNKKYDNFLEKATSILNDDSFDFSFNFNKYTIIPGFCDVHVHFREPGFFYKESIKSGTEAAARGGYSDVMTMPNLNPVPDSVENLKIQEDIIEKDAKINVYPYGAVTVREMGQMLSDISNMNVLAFSDDGKGIQDENLMRDAMLKIKSVNKVLAAHCEDNSLLKQGYIHDGKYASEMGHKGICSASEYKQIERDLRLAEETGVKYHVCHISTKESVELIRNAKARGVDVTCETAPHYLILSDEDLQEDGRFKMNPPLRARSDQEALIKGIKDGTIDMIATDHAPHSENEKSKGLEKSAFGIVGIETAFPLMYTYLVKKNIISLEKLIELMAINPRERFGIPYDDSFTIWDLESKAIIDSNDFLSKGKATPFDGYQIYGKCMATFVNGRYAYMDKLVK